MPMGNDKRPAYPGDRVPNAGWNETVEDRYHDHRGYRPHEPQQQPPPQQQQQQHMQHQGHPLQAPHPLPPHRDDRSAPPLPFHRQDNNATPPLSESNSSGRSMLNASPQMYRAEHPRERDHPREHPHPHPPPPHYAQQGPPPPPPPPPYPPGPSLQSTQQQHHQLQQQLQQGSLKPAHHSGAPPAGPFAPQPLFSQPPPPPQGPPHPHHHQRSASYSEPQHQQSQLQYHPRAAEPARVDCQSPDAAPEPPSLPANLSGSDTAPSPGFPSSIERQLFRWRREGPALDLVSRNPPRNAAPDGPGPFASEAPVHAWGQATNRGSCDRGHPIEQPTDEQTTTATLPRDEDPPIPSRAQLIAPPRRATTLFAAVTTPLAAHLPTPIGTSAPTPACGSISTPASLATPPVLPHTRTYSGPRPVSATAATPPQGSESPSHKLLPREPQPTPDYRTSSPRTAPPRAYPSTAQPASSVTTNTTSQCLASWPPAGATPAARVTFVPSPGAADVLGRLHIFYLVYGPYARVAVCNNAALPNLHQYGDDRKKLASGLEDPSQLLGERPHEPKPWDREAHERERSSDMPPLRAEEALVKGIHERKYPSAFSSDMMQSPKLKREVIVIEESEGMMKKDDDIEMTGVEGILSPHRRSEPQVERAAKRRKPYYTPSSHLRSDSTLSNLDEPGLLSNTPPKGPTFASVSMANGNNITSNASSLPSIPPQQVVDNSDVIEELKKHERHHLGSMVYSPTVVKKSGSVKSWSHIPLFTDRENGTFIVRIPWYVLSLEERERVCRKRLLWGTEVYSDDSNVLAVLIHLGYVPGVRDGQEVVEYASAHDTVVAKLSAPKRRGATARQREIAAMMTEGLPKPAQKIPDRKDLLVKLVVCGSLREYASVVKYGLKSRSWENHDGMSFMVEDVKWVEENYAGFGDKRGVAGVHERLAKWQKMRTANDVAAVATQEAVTGAPAAVTVSGSQWLVRPGVEKVETGKESAGAMHVDGEAEAEKGGEKVESAEKVEAANPGLTTS
ncbi:hypothetical protein DRE_03247 [Drechslerella stenobrocha 248]|uniref:Uncharacterized protein n=1 Tax=Drechslerella stenobrocha 248 TaxID=1043628 RepID=W7I5A5_9PEZI|nr:hypothetical protein DRE_03247 [Drechslerella stenobrocha 248]